MLVQLLFGYQYVVIKIGVAEFPPFFFLALRFVAIAMLLNPVPRPTRREIGPIIAISVFVGGLNFGLFYTGLGLGTGTMTAVAYQFTGPFIILLAWPLLEGTVNVARRSASCSPSAASQWRRPALTVRRI